MPKLKVMPLLGKINREERLDSLRACHAIHEREVVRHFDGGNFAPQLNEAVRELLLADRVVALNGSVQFIVQIEL